MLLQLTGHYQANLKELIGETVLSQRHKNGNWPN